MAEVPLLEVEDLVVDFRTPRGRLRAVDGASFTLQRGETLGLVGESGSGKSVTSLAILGLLGEGAEVVSGRILFAGRDLLRLGTRDLRAVRGARIAMIFQEPMTSLNPLFTVGAQIAEAVRLHERASRRAAWARAIEMLHLVEIPEPRLRASSYPHELSGGMRQRVMIAMALACRPELLIADEPTTALDVTIEAQILDLLAGLQRRFGMSVLLITHDLGVVASQADAVAMLYSGRVVERAPAGALFAAPAHPYTRLLLDSLPRLHERRERLQAIPGVVPDPEARPSGCRFHDRCWRATAECSASEPVLAPPGGTAEAREVACFHSLAPGEGP
ncbi:MAG: ABC transporter ATP-binding protein [Deltaproteobacteria bacterium]